MKLRFRKFLLVFFLSLLLPVHTARADTGPKPTMDFQFKQEMTGGQVTITSGILYECHQADCSDAAPLQEAGPQRLTCEAIRCHATAYGFRPYHRLEIRFSDGQTRQSNIFETAGFNSKYTVTIRAEDLLVESQFSPGIFSRTGILVVACLCALIGLGLLAAVIIFLVRRSKKT